MVDSMKMNASKNRWALGKKKKALGPREEPSCCRSRRKTVRFSPERSGNGKKEEGGEGNGQD